MRVNAGRGQHARDVLRISSVERGHVEIAIGKCVDGLDVVHQFDDARREHE